MMEALPGGFSGSRKALPLFADKSGGAYLAAENHLIKIDQSGKILWQAERPSPFFTGIGVSPDGNRVYTLTFNGSELTVTMAEASSGQSKWVETWKLPSSWAKSPPSSMV